MSLNVRAVKSQKLELVEVVRINVAVIRPARSLGAAESWQTGQLTPAGGGASPKAMSL